MMKQWRFKYPVTLMSRMLKVSDSGYYASQARPPQTHEELVDVVADFVKHAYLDSLAMKKRTR
jgi:hypothetical protein